jgi:voltage-gated potassium channel
MGNPLLVMWSRIFAEDQASRGRLDEVVTLPEAAAQAPSAGILLVLRRMRAPLIVVIVVFAVSVLGLTLVPGEDAQGRPTRMGIFEAFYFMSYTATTIGFGEIPHTFTPGQRMWVTFAIFLSVIGWAYAIGSLLALTQDRAFRRALSRVRFLRKVTRLGDPFLLLVGYGNATRRLARSLDDLGRRFVIIDNDDDRLARVDLDSYRADTPAVLGDARDTGKLVLAGLGHSHCEGVVVLTGDDATNLDVTMTTSLLRPDLPVVARAHSRGVAERMRTFGAPEVVNPLDRFGDHLRILLRSPSSYQLMVWLTSAPGTPLPPRSDPLPHGRWAVGGHGRFGRELTADLEAEGLEVVALPAGADDEQDDSELRAAVGHAEGFVAATESDVTNLWLIERARLANPDVFVATLQNRAANGPLFDALGVDFRVGLGELIAHEALARLANPVLMRFLPKVPRQGEEWAAAMVERLVDRCGTGAPDLWQVRLTAEEAPALHQLLTEGGVRLGDLLRSPRGREEPVRAVTLALLRDGEAEVGPADDVLLRDGDALLVAGRPAARRALGLTVDDWPTAAYVVEGRVVPSSWVWRRLSRDAESPRRQRG